LLKSTPAYTEVLQNTWRRPLTIKNMTRYIANPLLIFSSIYVTVVLSTPMVNFDKFGGYLEVENQQHITLIYFFITLSN